MVRKRDGDSDLVDLVRKGIIDARDLRSTSSCTHTPPIDASNKVKFPYAWRLAYAEAVSCVP
jgi:hypothetical protein